jgi:hypothetical protein
MQAVQPIVHADTAVTSQAGIAGPDAKQMPAPAVRHSAYEAWQPFWHSFFASVSSPEGSENAMGLFRA